LFNNNISTFALLLFFSRREEMKALPVEQQNIAALSLDLANGRDELNLAEFPLFSLGKVPRSVKTLRFESSVRDRRSNRVLPRTITITSADAYGLPTISDADVLLALISLGRQQNGLEERQVFFDVRWLIEELGWHVNGKNYNRIKSALQRWETLSIAYENWWCPRSKTFRHVQFGILNDFDLATPKKGLRADKRSLSSFRFSEKFHAELQKGNLRQLDLELYYRLKTPAAKQIYRFLGKRFYHQDQLSFELTRFAFEHVGLSRNYPVHQVKQKLKPALKELEKLGQIAPLAPSKRYTKKGVAVYDIHFGRGEKFTRPGPAVEQQEQPLLFDSELVQELARRGVHRATARKLVEDDSIDDALIEEKIEMLDWKQQQQPDDLPSNPAGWLVKAILEDYAPPANFETRAQREIREAKAAAYRKRRQQQAKKKDQAEERQKKQEETLRQDQWDRTEAYLNGLSARQRNKVIDAAIDNASDGIRPMAIAYRNNPVPNSTNEDMYQIVLREHVLPLLEDTAKSKRKPR